MIRYNSEKQLTIAEFKQSLGPELDPTNRWVVLADYIQWDDFAVYYYSKMDKHTGAPSKDARMVLGALIIKHLCKLSDESTISAIQENVYMQYFVGLRGFTIKPIFDSSLFVTIRKRLNHESLDKMVVTLIKEGEALKKKAILKKNPATKSRVTKKKLTAEN